MSCIQRLLRRREISDGGAIYDLVEGGKPIPVDEEGVEWVNDAIEREPRRTLRFAPAASRAIGGGFRVA